MATITSRDVIQELIDGNGSTHGDPQCLSIWEFRQCPTRKIMWCVVYVKEDMIALVNSPHTIIKCLWDQRSGMLDHPTKEGLDNPDTEMKPGT